MAKRKLKQNQKTSDDETETPRPAKHLKRQRNSILKINKIKASISSNEEHDSSMDSDNGNSQEITCNEGANESYYESFSSFMKAFAFDAESDDEQQMNNGISLNGYGSSMNTSEKNKSSKQVDHGNLSFQENSIEEEQPSKIRILSVPSKLREVVLLQHPARMTLHGYVNLTVCLGSISILGYNVKEGGDIKVFSTEGTGLKEVTTLKSVHKSTVKQCKKRLEQETCYEEDVKLDEFFDNIGPSSVVLVVKQLMLPPSIEVLELYYPNATQTKFSRSENLDDDGNFDLCSDQQAFVIDISKDFKAMSREVNKAICETASKSKQFGPRIMIMGDKKMGKSTLVRYLMNSSLNNHSALYFLDTDPGQTEYTPPGGVSLFRVTKPLLGPPFMHQKKPLRMIFIGSISPGPCPKLYVDSVAQLLKYFNANFPTEPLFVNTMGWNKGMGAVCMERLREIVKPTIVIELVPPEPKFSFSKEVTENGITCLKAASKVPPAESGASSFNAKELRNFSIVSYLGQSMEPYMPVSLINSFHPVGVCWDKIALHVMGKRLSGQHLISAIHCSIVALCHVDLSFVLKSDDPRFPLTLTDDPLCECLGYGLVRASDETNHIYYIVTPLKLDQLKNVNALVKGNIMIPDQIFLKQTIQNVPLPFTDCSDVPKTPARKPLRKRAHFRTNTHKS